MNTDRRSFLKILGAGALSLPAIAQALAAETPAAPKTYATNGIRFYPTQCYDENGQRLRGPLGPVCREDYVDIAFECGVNIEDGCTLVCTRANGSKVEYEMRDSAIAGYRIDGDRIVEVGEVNISLPVSSCDIKPVRGLDRAGIIIPDATVTVTWREYQTP